MKKWILLGCLIAVVIIGITAYDRVTTSLPVCEDCNVILITMTNLRYDHLSQNGYKRPTTPNIDMLAKKSLIFENAFAQTSWTLPEGISIYTSLYPSVHRIMGRYDGTKLDPKTPTIIDLLKKNGYLTAGFMGGFDYEKTYGLTSRLDHLELCPKETQRFISAAQSLRKPNSYGQFACTVPKAISWLKKNKDHKFFMHVQGFDAHCPFSNNGGKMYDKDYSSDIDYSNCLLTFDRTEPETKDGTLKYPVFTPIEITSKNPWGSLINMVYLGYRDIFHLNAIYDESITKADQKIGTLLDEVDKLGLSKNTIVIFTSEHGDVMGKYGRFMRGGPLRGTYYDDVLHIPLIIRNPAIKSPRHIDGLVQHIDLAPTLLDMLGIREPLQTLAMQGKNLAALIVKNREVNQYVYAGSNFTGSLQITLPGMDRSRIASVRSKDWKLIIEVLKHDIPGTDRTELYDIKNDPKESTNLAKKNPDKLKELQSLLSRWIKQNKL